MRKLDASECEVLAGTPEALQPVVLALRRQILAVHPYATIIAWPRQRIISFGLGPRKMTDHYAYVATHAHHVNLGLYRGAHLEATAMTLAGTGRNLRHVKLRTLADTRATYLRALIRLAFKERHSALAHTG